MSSASATPRVPFRFPFNPPDIALPLSNADFLTHHLSAQQKDTYIAGSVKWIATALALGGIYGLVRATRLLSSRESSSNNSSNRRRSQLQQTELNLEGIARGRKSRVSHAQKQQQDAHAAGTHASAAASAAAPTAPFSLGIITPRSLERYGKLLQGGFDELAAKEKNVPADKKVLKAVTMMAPEAEESMHDFVARVNSAKFDVLLLQYHGSTNEEVVAFQDYANPATPYIPTPRILLLHRPEEIMERHTQHMFKEAQYNVEKLIREVEVVVVLGEASRPALMKKFSSGSNLANICVVPHGFSAISEQPPQPRKLTPYTVVGTCSSFNDMRWVTDLVQLHKTVQEYAYPAATNEPQTPSKHKPAANISNALKQVVVYATGNFQSYVDPVTKQKVDQLTELKSSSYAQHIKFVEYHTFEEAEKQGKFSRNDVNSFKAFLYKLSEQGRKLLLCPSKESFEHPLHNAQGFDFNVQLFREQLKQFQPKVEYSGALHENPGAAIPIVFESPAMGDVEIEGMNLITVPYHGSSISASSSSSSSSTNSCCPPGAYPECCPWYPSAAHCPDFAPAVENIAKYILNPSHYHSHRVNTHDAAKQLTMRHAAAQYQHIVQQLFLD